MLIQQNKMTGNIPVKLWASNLLNTVPVNRHGHSRWRPVQTKAPFAFLNADAKRKGDLPCLFSDNCLSNSSKSDISLLKPATLSETALLSWRWLA